MCCQIEITLAGLRFFCRLRNPDAAAYFPKPDPGAASVGTGFVSLTEEDWAYFAPDGADRSARTEYSLLCFPCSEALMRHDRILVHGAALRWRDRAWLICAPSGVGKSTQARFLQALRPGEFGVICGDRPVLEFCHSERSEAESKNPSPTILVHPSPWNGKENWRGAEAAPLAGIILLERGVRNRLFSVRPRDAALPFFQQLIQSARNAEMIRLAADYETHLLNAVPLWKLVSHEAPDSTRLLLESVF